MLGKGLESLIPQKGNQNTGNSNAGATNFSASGNALDPSVKPVIVAAPAVETKQDLPVEKPAEALPVTLTEKDLPPALPKELDLPHSDEQIIAVSSPVVSVTPLAPLAQPIVMATPESRISMTSNPVPMAQKKGDPVPQEYIFHIEVEKIKPNSSQPRREFNETAIREMANSIREFGFLQPLVVSKVGRETPDGVQVEYQLIAGERRLRAAKLLGLREVPAIIRNVDLEREKLELAVIENLQRENLNSVEMARAFQRLQEEFRMTQREIAAKLGKSRETVANTVRLLDLPEYIQDALQKGQLSESHARLLLAIEDPSAQKRIYDDIVEHGLTTRDVKERVKQFSGGVGHRGRPSLAEMEANLPPELRAMQDELSSSLGAPVQIQKGAGTGKITISFYSQEELENILHRLGKENS